MTAPQLPRAPSVEVYAADCRSRLWPPDRPPASKHTVPPAYALAIDTRRAVAGGDPSRSILHVSEQIYAHETSQNGEKRRREAQQAQKLRHRSSPPERLDGRRGRDI